MVTRIIVLSLLTLSSCHLGRYVWYNFADYKDHKKFPSREISASSQPFAFQKSQEQVELPFARTNYDSLEDFLDDSKSLSFLVIRNDTIIYDWYREKFDSSSVFTTFSMVKSFVSLLVGIAIDEGHIRSVDDPITRYIPELTDSSFNDITIKHVLEMQSGIKFNESYYNPFGTVAKFYYGRKLKKYVSRLKVEKAPGQKFEYKSLDTQLLGLILENATGKKLATYFQEKLWQPLGMEYDASWSIDSRPHDTEKAFCCLNARTVDLAKLGRLVLSNGEWEGTRIVSENWLNDSFKGSDNFKGYGYQWWLYQQSGAIVAQGILGQYLVVFPEKNMIVVRMGKKWANVAWISFIAGMVNQM